MSTEVDAYANPTILFSYINDGSETNAISRALEYRDEVQTWIVSRTKSSSHASQGEGRDEAENGIRWKYLPLHLACLQPNPSIELINALLRVFPRGAKARDYHGHLPLHHLLFEGCENLEIIKTVFNAYEKALLKTNGEGRIPEEIIQNLASKRAKCSLQEWLSQELKNISQSEQVQRQDKSYILSNENTMKEDSCNELVSLAVDDEPHSKMIQEALRRKEEEVSEYKQKTLYLERACKSRDERIDNITTQMHHLKQLSQQHSRRVDMPVDEPQQSGNTSSQHFIKELESLKEESKFDAEIVASQEKRIKELEIKLDTSSNETNSYRQEIKKLKEAFTIIQEKSQKNDENLFHLRKVTNILQMEITAKDQDLKHLRERLQIALSEKEKLEMNSREENVNVSDLKKGFTRQNEELLSFISSLSLHLSQSIPVASKGNETKEDDHQEQSPSSVKVKIPITNNIETLRLQMERIEKCVFSMTNQVKQPDKENSSLFDENDSLCNQLKDMKEEKGKCQENVNHAQSMTIFSHAEIKQRQVHLQEELNEIYKQIKASIPPSYGKGGKSDSRPEIDTSLQLNRRDELLEEFSRSKIDTSQRPERRDELLEEFRPWRKHAQTEKR